MGIVIAMDGVSGSGKSTLARMLSKSLGFSHVNAGDIYRALTAFLILSNTHPDERVGVLVQAHISFDGDAIFVNNTNVSHLLHSPDVEELVAHISPIPEIRARVRTLQYEIVEHAPGVVMEGRDIATLFPDALLKFFITASALTRAERRYARNMSELGESLPIETLTAQLEERDHRDMNRDHGRLVAAPDAITIDTTGATAEESLAIILNEVETRQPQLLTHLSTVV